MPYDFLWSNQCKDVEGWGMSDRGVSYTFSANIVTKFLQKHDLDLVCRAHQVFDIYTLFFFKGETKESCLPKST
ncbi:hypothetical protein OSB04_025799 [Centaurea solstitialis]|uniref:protein-serine/threonine phosphatase n=1 Tax=Centaurea solstitialis TaxID=347529 RepID=A0AA38W4B3_9ASTR|nr:hypothetical protein OSB04_025799 [Centaurea solstitialis]